VAKKRGKRNKNIKSLRLIIIISFIIFLVIIIASFFGLSADNSVGYFHTNVFTGECSFVVVPDSYPWYYQPGCYTVDKKVEAAKKTDFYNETIIQCNSICAINNAKKYCNISAFPGVSCNDLVKCASISC
jgi:hypothetical protein